MKFRVFLVLLTCIACLAPNGASAQIIGNAIANSMGAASTNWSFVRCAGGKSPLSELAAQEAENAAQAIIARYWTAVSATDDAQIGTLFDVSEKAVWIANGSEVRVHSQPITDPFARGNGNVLATKPVIIVQSINGQTARGVWEVTNSSGSPVGFYRIDFEKKSTWRPIRIELLPTDTPSPIATPYCYSPGDIETYSVAAKAISESEIAKLVQKAKVVASCIQGLDCAEKWSRAQRWIEENRTYLLVRNTETLLLNAKPVKADVTPTYLVALDEPTPDGRRTIRFRSWCGNMFACFPSAGKTKQAFVAFLEQVSTEDPQPSM